MDQSVYSDESAAYEQFLDLVFQVAAQYSWDDEALDAAVEDVNQAHEDADGWFSSPSAEDFWIALAESSDAWEGEVGERLRKVIAAALVALGTIEEEEVTGLEYVAGTVEGSVADVTTGAQAVADTVASPYFKPLAALAGLAVLVLLVRR